MEHAKDFVKANIAPPVGAMIVCILGAFLVYKGFYDGAYIKDSTAKMSAIAPAAGNEFVSDGVSYRVIDTNNVAVWHGTIQHDR